jgi:flavin-dependent dehydrogenase
MLKPLVQGEKSDDFNIFGSVLSPSAALRGWHSARNNKKVAIIGGGICGLYLAWKLAEKGENVTVFEKKPEIGNEICSGLFSQRILEFIPQSRNLIQNRIKSALLYFPGKTVRLNFSKEFFVMSHFELDRLVASLAQKAGANIFLDRNVNSLPEGFDKIIGCDGSNSFIRKNLNLPDPNFRLGIQGFLEKESHLDFVETWPCRQGFLWKIPRGNEIEYGIIAKPEEAKKIFDEFLRKNNISLVNLKAKLIPQGLIIPKNKSITLCGDAAGLTKPWSGGGVIWGLKAAEILLETFPNFKEYRKLAKRFFLPKIILSKTVIKVGYFLGFNISWLLPKNAKIESDFLL